MSNVLPYADKKLKKTVSPADKLITNVDAHN